MTNITTRTAVGRPLTYAEMDGNFNKLNSGKAEQGAVDALSQKVTQTANTANSAMQGVNQLESPSGASLVGIGTDNVGSVLNALQLTNYAALRAYTGARQNVFLTGYSVAAVPLGIAGMFIRDDYDKSTIDNNATVIVSTDGTRWKRAITGPINVQWFGAMGNSTTDDTAAIQSAVDYLQSISAGYSSPIVTLFFPQGKYYIKGTISINFNTNVMQLSFDSSGAWLIGAGNNVCFSFNNGGYRNLIEKLTFTNFSTAIRWTTNNRDQCHLEVKNFSCGSCDIFLDTVNYASSRSSMVTLSNGLISDTRVAVNHYTDQMTVEKCWVYAKNGAYDALFYLSGDGNVHIKDTFLIANATQLDVPKNGRWIDFVSDPANCTPGDRSLKRLKLSSVRQSLESARPLIWTFDTCSALPNGNGQVSSIVVEDSYCGGTGGNSVVTYKQGYTGSTVFRNTTVLASPYIVGVDAANTKAPVPSTPGAITFHVIQIDEPTRLSQSNSNNSASLIDPKLEAFCYDTTSQTSKYKRSIQRNIDYRLAAVQAPGAGTNKVKVTIPVFFDSNPAVANRGLLLFDLVTVGDAGAAIYSNPAYGAIGNCRVAIVGGNNGGAIKRIVVTPLMDAKGGLSNLTDSSALPTVFWGQGDTGSADISASSTTGTEDYITMVWSSSDPNTSWAYLLPIAGLRENQWDRQQFGVW